jgi:Zn-dependent protease with chaperone function
MCLLLLGAAGGLLIPMLLPRLVSRSALPRVALSIWLLGSLSVIASWALLGGLLPNTVAALAVVGTIIGRLGYAFVSVAVRDHRRRGPHAQAVRIVGREDPTLGATILDSEVPAVYCLPGRAATVVVTSTARDVLSDDQLHAALAHEHAHLTGRHHLLLELADAVTRAFPGVRLFDRSARETRRLVEILADDAAANRHGRRVVAEALLRLACARHPSGALATARRAPPG